MASITSREPEPEVATLPSDDGTLPTMTNPSRRVAKAVDSPVPLPPNTALGTVKKVVAVPLEASTLMIVVPVPCRLFPLLKLETRMSPATKGPALF